MGWMTQHRQQILVLSKASRLALGLIQSPIQWGSFQEVKWTECKADHLPLPAVKVKNEWCYTVTSPSMPSQHAQNSTTSMSQRKGCLAIKKFQVEVKLPCESQREILLRFCQHERQCSYVHLNLDIRHSSVLKTLPFCSTDMLLTA